MDTSNTLGAWQTFWQMSGAAFALLFVLALIIQAVLVIAPLKWLQLRRVLAREDHFEQALEGATDVAQIKALIGKHPNAPGARVLYKLIQLRERQPLGYESLLGAARRAINQEQKQCGRFMPTLSSIASTAPLIGLFGTVWGIIEAFLTISAEKSSELPVIAPAMSGALLTTALGLMAAIPAAVAYNFGNAAIEGLLDDLDTIAQSWAGRLADSDAEVTTAQRTPGPEANQ